MLLSILRKLLLICGATALMLPAAAVEPRPVMPRPGNPGIRLSRSAGYIFLGKVLSVRRISPSTANATAAMEISFRVQRGYRGVPSGATLVIHEWAGLWQSGERYRPGDVALLFLYPPSKLGLTSPVEGPFGHIPAETGQILITPALSFIRSHTPGLQGRFAGKRRLAADEFVHILLDAKE